MSSVNNTFPGPAPPTFPTIPKPRSLPAKAPPGNVFSNDGSFLNRVKREMKQVASLSQEDEDKKKQQEALERKKNFADRFKNRGKRPPPTDSADTTPELEESPHKKVKYTPEADDAKHKNISAQAKYHKTIGSYPTSLKDTGTGVRSLAK